METKMRIVLGMSGGVDSSTSAMLLLQAGYDVVGVTCLFLDNEATRVAARDAAQVCDQLGIPHVARDCTAEFEEAVVAPFVHDYAQGLTPSPCVYCNVLCKIPLLMKAADELNCEKVATGHYARIAQLTSNKRFVLKAALDVSKDQSYMLSQLTQEQLSRLVFPLGAATKAEVRVIAGDAGLVVAQKPESQDICFIKGNYRDFLELRGLLDQSGNIVTKEGKVVGQHLGLFHYTTGQRKGIGLAASEPYYVIDKRLESNELVVGFQADTLISEVLVANPNWQAFGCLDQTLECMVKLRYRSRAIACTLEPISEGDLLEGSPGGNSGLHFIARLKSPQATTAPGQFAVFYEGETVLGGGVIQGVF